MSPLDELLKVTVFASVDAPKGVAKKISFRTFAGVMGKTIKESKDQLQLIEFARFKGNYRNDANLIEFDAIACDYDDEEMPIEEAGLLLRRAKVASLLYESPSSTPDAPRWRVQAVLSRPHSPSERAALVARLNGILGGVLAGESFTASQCYYYGGVGKPPKVILIEGDCLDERDDLDAGAIGKSDAPKQKTKSEGKVDRNKALFALACQLHRAGKTFADFEAAWPEDEIAAAHVRTDAKGKKRDAKTQARIVRRTWERAQATVDAEGDHILLAPSDLNTNLEKLDDALRNARRLDVFQRSGRIVFIRDGVDGMRDGRKIWTPLIHDMTAPQMQQAAMSALSFQKFDSTKGAVVPAECPEKFAAHYLCRTEWRLPYLYGIVSHPTLRADGSIVTAKGYDRSTGVFYAPGIAFPDIPATPTPRQVDRAVEALEDVVRGFDFADDSAFAAWAACLITALIRPTLPWAPIFGFDAPVAGSGKTKLATSISLIVRGETVETMNQPPTPEEEEKRLFAALSAGKRFVLFDNCTRPLDGEHLCAIATSPMWGARVLGKSENRSFPTAITIMATGNNLAFRGDLASRAFVCRLAPKVANPRTRKFKWSFEDECIEMRAYLVAAALTIVRGYLAGDQNIEPRTRFPEWDRMVRQPLIAAGVGDVVETMQEEESDTRESALLVKLLKAWRRTLGKSPVRLKQLAGRVRLDGDPGGLLDVLGDIAWIDKGAFDTAKLGYWLRERRDIHAGGLVLRCQPDESKGSRWWVEQGGIGG